MSKGLALPLIIALIFAVGVLGISKFLKLSQPAKPSTQSAQTEQTSTTRPTPQPATAFKNHETFECNNEEYKNWYTYKPSSLVIKLLKNAHTDVTPNYSLKYPNSVTLDTQYDNRTAVFYKGEKIQNAKGPLDPFSRAYFVFVIPSSFSTFIPDTELKLSNRTVLIENFDKGRMKISQIISNDNKKSPQIVLGGLSPEATNKELNTYYQMMCSFEFLE